MSETTKFAYIYWVGKDVPFTKRGKYGIKSGSVKKIFEVSGITIVSLSIHVSSIQYVHAFEYQYNVY